MRHALENFTVLGVDTTIPFLSSLMKHPDFISGKTNTRWLEEVIGRTGG
jgi:acetyl-CoA carboxylase biotin carboxylase subunit